MYDLTGDDNPQQQGMGGGGFNMGGMGINIEDLMGGFGFGGGGFGGGQQRRGGQQRGGQRGGATYTFTFNGGDGMRF